MFKTISAVLFAAVVFDATIAPSATRVIEPAGPQRSLKGDRLQLHPVGSACPESTRPYRETHCVQHGVPQPAAQPRETRVVAVPHLSAEHSAVAG